MKTRPIMMVSTQNDILFDDRSLLEAAFGKDALNVFSANANCDCIGYSTSDDEDTHTYQVATVAG